MGQTQCCQTNLQSSSSSILDEPQQNNFNSLNNIQVNHKNSPVLQKRNGKLKQAEENINELETHAESGITESQIHHGVFSDTLRFANKFFDDQDTRGDE